MTNKTIILKSLVGSRAHNLHTEQSDYDYRGVHITPTREIVAIGFKYSGTSWLEGDIDETSYEIGHFLQLCTKANPSVLEVLVSTDVQIDTPYAQEMRRLLPYMYDPKNAFNAFAGYSKNQQKKLLENHLNRREKFGVAYVRTAYNLLDLFEKGCFSLRVEDEARRQILMNIRTGLYRDGEIIDLAEQIINQARLLLPQVENRQDLDRVNDFLLKVRKENW
ncbi:hypothetical protein GCM10027347_59450 [Larkinella harenae]